MTMTRPDHSVLFAVALFLIAATVRAGSFQLSQAIRASSPDAVAHQLGYTGAAANLTIDVCVDPASQFAPALVAPLQNAVDTLNALQPTIGTYVPPGSSTEVPADHWDVESVLLHEISHGLGLDHTNLGVLVIFFFSNATFSTEGPDTEFTFTFIGGDNIWGSDDDERGDDMNLVWFRKSTNDPFFIDPLPPPPVDSTTYSRDLADLPTGHNYAANGGPAVAGELGYPSTRASMYAQEGPQSEFRNFANDDVATYLYSLSGLDELAGTADDYTFTIQVTAHPCDFPVRFAALGASPVARAGVNYNLIAGSGDHYEVEPVFVELNSDFTWFFGPAPDLQITKDDGGVSVSPGDDVTYTLEVINVGQLDATGVEIQETVPENTTFNAGASDPAWNCSDIVAGAMCTLPVGSLTAGGSSVQASYVLTVDNPLAGGVTEITNAAQVVDDGNGGPDPDTSNNSAQETTPIVSSEIFSDGFESGDTAAWSASAP